MINKGGAEVGSCYLFFRADLKPDYASLTDCTILFQFRTNKLIKHKFFSCTRTANVFLAGGKYSFHTESLWCDNIQVLDLTVDDTFKQNWFIIPMERFKLLILPDDILPEGDAVNGLCIKNRIIKRIK